MHLLFQTSIEIPYCVMKANADPHFRPVMLFIYAHGEA